MKGFVIAALMVSSVIASGQPSKRLPRLGGDTLYTESGFKLYTGQVLKFNLAHYSALHFQYIHGLETRDESIYDHESLTILKMKHLYSSPGNVYILFKGRILFKDHSTAKMNLKLNFEPAINPKKGIPAELVIP
jgi:hypothetical protein